ncbi:MAG: PaaI family thioesterase, partial [Mariprofundus sp.]|nr:PaaI family thioesterase [Mariprofundus sp.]
LTMNTTNMTGLEIMQAMEQGVIPYPSMTETVPMKFIALEKGRIVFEVKADKRHLNIFGGVHGGFSATVLDTVTGCVVHTMLGAGTGYATIDLSVKMLRPVPKDVPLLVEGTIISVTKSIGVSEGALKDEAGKLYAHATATCKLIV